MTIVTLYTILGALMTMLSQSIADNQEVEAPANSDHTVIMDASKYEVVLDIISCLSWTLAVLPLVVSPCCAYVMYKKRHFFPIKHFNIRYLVVAELTVPVGVWGVIVYNIRPTWPCWIALLGWDLPYFPLLTIVIVSIIKLRLDYDFCQHTTRRRDSKLSTSSIESTSKAGPWESFVLPLCRTSMGATGGGIKSSFFLSPILLRVIIALFFWAEGWLSVIPRAVRTYDYWMGPAISSECNTFTAYDNWMDLANITVYTVTIILLAKYLLRPVREVLGIRKRFLSVAAVILCMTIVQDTFGMIAAHLSEDDDLALAYALLSLYGGLMWNCVTYSLSVPLIREVYRQQKLAVETSASKNITKKDLLSLLLEPSNNNNLVRDAEEFRNYLLLELCVENAEYMKLSLAFKRAKTDEERIRVTKRIVKAHLVAEDRHSPMMELNIGDKLRKQIIMTYESQGHLPMFWKPVDEEVISMLMDPYLRFRRRAQSVVLGRRDSTVKADSAVRGPPLIIDNSNGRANSESMTRSNKKSAVVVIPT